jgi:ubiquinone/menaquinone biosynthesis C-methylase UbiE
LWRKDRATGLAVSDSEGDRIRRVYRHYMPTVSARWDPDNIGNRVIVRDRWRLTRKLFERSGQLSLLHGRVLDVGCGVGKVLRGFIEMGARPDKCVGVDLLPERIKEAQETYPDIEFHCANGEHLSFPDGAFDVALAFTLFSSILDDGTAAAVAREITRVLTPAGALVWYDIRYDNPSNPNVRGLAKAKIRELFPAFELHLQTATVLPPLVRRLGRLAPVAYPLLARLPLLRTHYLGLLLRRGQDRVETMPDADQQRPDA